MTLALKKLSSNKIWLLVAILAAGLLIPQFAFAYDMSGFLGDVIYWIVIKPVSKLLELEVWILPMIAQYNNFTGQEGVIKGWVALRDLANMFFILVLLVIAFATILRIQKYGYRQLLSRFLIMAILINFSMTIVGLVIDLSQVIMLTFVSAIKEVAAGNVVVALGLDKVMNMGAGSTGASTYITAMFLGAIMLIVAVVIIGIYIMILAMRIVKLWIEIVVAPIAFLAYTFPDTQKFYNEWVQELIKDIVVGPSLVFFLWLAFTITGSGGIGAEINAIDPSSTTEVGGDVSEAAEPPNLLNFVIGIAMLMAGLQMSAKAGGVGASLAGKTAAKINAVPGRIGRRAAVGAGGLVKAGAIRGYDAMAASVVDNKGLKESESRGGRFGRRLVRLADKTSFGAIERAGHRATSRQATRLTEKTDKAEQGMSPMRLKAYRQARARSFSTDSMITSADEGLMRTDVDSGGITTENLQRNLEIAEAAGDMTRKKKMQVTRADAYTTQEEVGEVMQEKGASFISRFTEDSLMQAKYETDANGNKVRAKDANGNDAFEPTEAAKMIAEALVNNDSISNQDLGKEMAKMPEASRAAFMKIISGLGTEIEGAFDITTTRDDKGREKTKVDLNKDNTAIKQLLTSLQNSPQTSTELHDRVIGTVPEGAQRKAASEEVISSASKGLDFAKVVKLDITKKDQKELFVKFAKNANNTQQKQIYDSGDDEQIELLVKTLQRENKSMNKVLQDYADRVKTEGRRPAGFRPPGTN